MVSYINRGKEYVPVNQKLFANTVHSFIGFRERGQEHFLNTDLLDKCKVLTQTDIRYIAEHPGEVRRMGERSRQLAERTFNIRQCTREMASVIKRMAVK